MISKKVKDKWISALESGDYTPCPGILEKKEKDKTFHCCIGVLGDILPELENDYSEQSKSPYQYLKKTIGEKTTQDLWTLNDTSVITAIRKREERNYKNVITFIKALKTDE